MAINPEEFGESFLGFIDQMRSHKKPEEGPFFVRKLRDHFGTDPSALLVLSESIAKHDHPNLHLALESYLAGSGRSFEVLGVVGPKGFMGKGMADLVAPHSGFGGSATQGPVEYANVALDGDRVLACAQRGLYLVRDGALSLAIFVRSDDRIHTGDDLVIEVMAADRSAAERFLGDLREGMRAHSVYRGHIISLGGDGNREMRVTFHHRPSVERDAVVLPVGLLERIERETIGYCLHRDRLRAAGRHMKRGLLLHGPPGTGKTLTIMYLAGSMRDRTVLLLTGRGPGMVGRTCAMARALEPAIVILEDVDMVSEERTNGSAGCPPLLFELLNEMDAMAENADIMFLLTTNRPELLEPTLASRPGRIDHAIEIPTPDESCRRRLFALYGRGLTLKVADLPRMIARIEGASAAFIRELLRRAALFAADDGNELVVTDRHLDAALHDLVFLGGEIAKSSLGFHSRIVFGGKDRGPGRP
jgi:hypothetical protein